MEFHGIQRSKYKEKGIKLSCRLPQIKISEQKINDLVNNERVLAAGTKCSEYLGVLYSIPLNLYLPRSRTAQEFLGDSHLDAF